MCSRVHPPQFQKQSWSCVARLCMVENYYPAKQFKLRSEIVLLSASVMFSDILHFHNVYENYFSNLLHNGASFLLSNLSNFLKGYLMICEKN